MPITMIPSISGGANLTTAGRVMIVAGPGVAGQSDVSLASGVFSRAGTLGLSATGANSVTLATNGSTRLTVDSSGNAAFTQQISALYAAFSNPGAVNGVLGTRLLLESGADGTLGALYTSFNMFPSATGSARYVTIQVGDNSAYRPLALQPAGGNLLVGTTTDDGASKLQVAGVITTNGAGGGLQINTRNSGANWTQYVAAGTLSFYNGSQNLLTISSAGTATLYNPTATTGVTSLVVRAGAGQSSTALQMWQDNAGTTLAQVGSDGQLLTDTVVNFVGATQGLVASGSIDIIKRNSSTGEVTISTNNEGVTLAPHGTTKFKASNTGIGFFGVTPVVRQTATDITEVIAALQAYGLLT